MRCASVSRLAQGEEIAQAGGDSKLCGAELHCHHPNTPDSAYGKAQPLQHCESECQQAQRNKWGPTDTVLYSVLV